MARALRMGVMLGWLVAGCATVNDRPSIAEVSGTWEGWYRVGTYGSLGPPAPGSAPTVVMRLQQDGSAVTGDMSLSGPAGCTGGAVKGRIDGTTLSVTVGACQPMQFYVKNDEMTGEFPNQYGTTNQVVVRRRK
jgi:hypothetical protein